jgi:hypothetical protein
VAYAFEPILLIDAANPTSRAASASVTVYDANDAGNTTPLALTDLNGVPLTNPLTSTADAFTPAFSSPSSQVKIVGGGLTVVAGSYSGLLDELTTAQNAASNSAADAQSAADDAAAAQIAAAGVSAALAIVFGG